MKLKIPVLCILIPSFNESESFDFCLNNLSKILTKLINEKKIAKNSYLYFVDDGSTDDSWKKILKKSKDLSFVKGVRLYKNVGHQNALLYGIKKILINAVYQYQLMQIYSRIQTRSLFLLRVI